MAWFMLTLSMAEKRSIEVPFKNIPAHSPLYISAIIQLNTHLIFVNKEANHKHVFAGGI